MANYSELSGLFTETQNKFSVYEMCLNGTSGMKQLSVKDMFGLLNTIKPNILVDTKDDDINNYDRINLRDLRRLDYNFNSNGEAVISIRKHAVIFSIDTTRAIITSKKLYYIVPNGADSILDMIGKHMNYFDKSSEYFEYHAYDGLLTATKHLDVMAINNVRQQSTEIINKLKKNAVIPTHIQEKLKLLKNTMTELSKHFDKIKQVLSDIIEDDEKLIFMNLTLFDEKPNIFKDIEENTEIMEIREKMSSMFEVYLFDYNNLSMQINTLCDNIKHSEESAMLRLSSMRNQLMIVNTIISIIACTIGFCAYVTGVFGMNLDNTKYIQPVPGVFNGVIISTMTFMPTVTILTILFLKKYDFIPI